MVAARVEVPGQKGNRVIHDYFDFRRGSNQFRCELTDRGEHGWVMDVFKNGDPIDNAQFPTRELAEQAADRERRAIEQGAHD